MGFCSIATFSYGRDLGLKLRDYFPGHFAFDCEYIGEIAIVTLPPRDGCPSCASIN